VKKYICEHFWRFLNRIEATIINQPFNIVLFKACVETKDAYEFLEFDVMPYNDGNCYFAKRALCVILLVYRTCLNV
jgi:hypothetical protein